MDHLDAPDGQGPLFDDRELLQQLFAHWCCIPHLGSVKSVGAPLLEWKDDVPCPNMEDAERREKAVSA